MPDPYPSRIQQCGEHPHHPGIDVLLRTKPSNTFNLTGDSSLYAHAMTIQDSKVAPGVPAGVTQTGFLEISL